MTAIQDRERVWIPCDACVDVPFAADWEYVRAEAGAPRYFCDAHYELIRLVEPTFRPEDWARVQGRD